jgi:hypothetical protein
VGVFADFSGRMVPIWASQGVGRGELAGSGRSRAQWPWSAARWPVSAGLSVAGFETAICAATLGRWPLKPMPPVGRSVAVARASTERRGGPLSGRAGCRAVIVGADADQRTLAGHVYFGYSWCHAGWLTLNLTSLQNLRSGAQDVDVERG